LCRSHIIIEKDLSHPNYLLEKVIQVKIMPQTLEEMVPAQIHFARATLGLCSSEKGF